MSNLRRSQFKLIFELLNIHCTGKPILTIKGMLVDENETKVGNLRKYLKSNCQIL